MKTFNFIQIEKIQNTIHILLLNSAFNYYTSIELKEEISKYLEEESIKFQFDLKNVQFIDSSGLGFLSFLITNVKHSRNAVTIINSKNQINELLIVSGFSKKIQIINSQ
jgi:stage II sporulation protein AA (anti-sigma F factor antagonist)